MKEIVTLSVIGFVLFLIANFADYQLQAEQHGWNGLLWERYHRADKWPDPFDWIPHDAWHVAQTVRNTFDKIAAVLVFTGFVTLVDPFLRRIKLDRTVLWWTLSIAGMFLLYAIARGLAFSLPYRLFNS